MNHHRGNMKEKYRHLNMEEKHVDIERKYGRKAYRHLEEIWKKRNN